jgi:hypothetical protein
MEIIVWNYAFFEDPKSINLAIPLLVVETTYAPLAFPLFSKLVYLTSNSKMGFLQAFILLFIFKIVFCLSFNNFLLSSLSFIILLFSKTLPF